MAAVRFGGDTPFATITAVVNDEPPPLEAPAALERIVSRCLAKQPRDRFQSMTEVKTALEQAVVRSADPQPSIAVLPFANMSRDPDDEYFSDGLAEETHQPAGPRPQPQGHGAHLRPSPSGARNRTSAGSPRRSASRTFSKAASAAREAGSA